ncbi:MAG: hypothetical protein OEZ02_12015, partial [Anaerolineae bacterium]|nr:hypothetical protein [Anaerolineae bacterium]
MNNNKSLFKSLRLALFIVLGFIIYAYGFQVTKVSLTEFRKESRIVSRERIMRSLARPDILEWEQEEFIANIPIYVPCKPDAPALPEVDTSGPYMVFDPPCGEPGSEIQIHGYNFPPNTSGPVSFLPGDDPANTLRLRTVHVRIDNAGEFHTAFELAERSNDETYNLIRATIRRNIGRPQFSTNALLTWDLIIETVFLALLATTLGTLLAMPISFLAARNIMKDVKSLLASISLSILGWPFGIFLGYQGAKYLSHFSASLSPTPLANLGSLIAALVLIWGLVRWAVPEQDEKLPQTSLRIARILAQSLAAACAIAAVQLLASLGISSGETIAASIGSYAFLAKFVATSADILGVIAPLLAALAGGAVIGNFASRFGQLLTERLPNAAIKTFNIISSGIAGASLFLIISSALGWLYEIT